jgi:hypothetical protein
MLGSILDTREVLQAVSSRALIEVQQSAKVRLRQRRYEPASWKRGNERCRRSHWRGAHPRYSFAGKFELYNWGIIQ